VPTYDLPEQVLREFRRLPLVQQRRGPRAAVLTEADPDAGRAVEVRVARELQPHVEHLVVRRRGDHLDRRLGEAAQPVRVRRRKMHGL